MDDKDRSNGDAGGRGEDFASTFEISELLGDVPEWMVADAAPPESRETGYVPPPDNGGNGEGDDDVDGGGDENRRAARLSPKRRRPALIAACLLAVVCLSIGGFAMAADAAEYREAVEFFMENGLSAEGLSRSEIKAVYRDISTDTFEYGLTGDVIARSLETEGVEGFAFEGRTPGKDELKRYWEYRDGSYFAVQTLKYEGDVVKGIWYESIYSEDRETYLIRKYSDDEVVWETEMGQSRHANQFAPAGKEVLAFGSNYAGGSRNPWLCRLSEDGEILWQRTLLVDGSIDAVLPLPGGKAEVIYRGRIEDRSLKKLTVGKDGQTVEEVDSNVSTDRIVAAARTKDGYVMAGNWRWKEEALRPTVWIFDRDFKLKTKTEFSDGERNYFFNDILVHDGKIYISAYTTKQPKAREGHNYRDYVIAAILEWSFSEGMEPTGEGGMAKTHDSAEMLKVVRDNFEAVLLVCDVEASKPETLHTVSGGIGAELSVDEGGNRVWRVDNIINSLFSPGTSAFTYRIEGEGTEYVFSGGKDTPKVRKTDNRRNYFF